MSAEQLQRARCAVAEKAWNGRPIAYGDVPYPTEAQRLAALAWILWPVVKWHWRGVA